MKWRKNFEIKNANFNLVGYSPQAFIKNIPLKNGKQLFRECIFEHDGSTIRAYIPIDVIESVVEWIKEKIISEPDWARKLHVETEKINWDYFNYAKILEKTDLTKLTNQELLDKYLGLKELQRDSHFLALSTTWFVDSDNEVFSNYLRIELNRWLSMIGINDTESQVEYFTILTTPDRENLAQQEQIEFLELVKKIKEKSLDECKKNINEHYKKWCWTPYGYIGPAYDLNHYLDEIKNTLKKITDLDLLLTEEKNRNIKAGEERKKLEKEISLPKNLKELFSIAREIIWLKDFRKYCIWYGHFVLDKLTKEISKRLDITHKQANFFVLEEVKKALLNNDYDENILNERIKYCVIHFTFENTNYHYSDEAKKIIQNLEIEETKSDFGNGFKGNTACPGKIEGIVKIVNDVKDIDKVQNGDILLAISTYPSFLPAMKRCGAIITEDGGITCHAAIVAREFKIPCIVGVKGIMKFLKDGDIVEVDGYKGIVKKL